MSCQDGSNILNNTVTQKILTRKEIWDFILSLKAYFKNLTKLREIDPYAHYIQYPKIPSILSESIIYHLIVDKKILSELDIISAKREHRVADIVLYTEVGTKNVEVKSTGGNAFQNLGKKDINADYLIWLHFDKFFTNEMISEVSMYIVSDPNKYFFKTGKINLKKFRIAFPSIQCITLNTKELLSFNS